MGFQCLHSPQINEHLDFSVLDVSVCFQQLSFFSILRLFGTENVHPLVYKSSDNTFRRFDFHNYMANYYVPLLGQLVTSGVVVERIPVH